MQTLQKASQVTSVPAVRNPLVVRVVLDQASGWPGPGMGHSEIRAAFHCRSCSVGFWSHDHVALMWLDALDFSKVKSRFRLFLRVVWILWIFLISCIFLYFFIEYLIPLFMELTAGVTEASCFD